jgi:HK97 family phage major capsid protein/HK97 family phage prohead protease
MNRAYSRLEIKSVDEAQRVITGIATSASTDRMGDVVEPGGAQFELPIPLLWQHDSKQPIGTVTAAKATKNGIEITAQIASTDIPGQLKDRLDMAWQSIALGLVRGLSIGFQSLEESYDKVTGGFHFLEWLWLELSAVTIPANQDASIQTIKSLDVGLSADIQPAGASASRRVLRTIAKDRTTMKKSIADQIADWTNTRAVKAAEQDAIQAKANEANRAKDTAEREAFTTLTDEIKGIDDEIADLRVLEAREKAAVVEVKGATVQQGLQARAGAVITVNRELPKGILFARYAMCMGASRGNTGEAMRLAQKHYPDDPGVMAMVEKTAVTGGATSGSHYLDDMVPYSVMNDFIEYLRPGSIIGKFGGPNPGGGPNYPTLRRVGFNERVSGISTGYVAAWKGEGLPAIPTAAVTFNTTLTYNNVAALAILTKEAIRFSNPSAEARVRDDLARAVNTKLDVDFIDPGKAASGTTSPASITNGVVAVAPTTTTAAALVTDMTTLLKQFTQNNLDASDVVLIMSASQALQISMMTTTLGMLYFPNISMVGGNFRGLPVITSENLQSVGSPSTNSIVAVKASEVYLADDGVVTVDASDQASLEMQSTSSASAISGTGASLVSLWQTGAVGLLAHREITWKMRRSTAVGYISPAAYVA